MRGRGLGLNLHVDQEAWTANREGYACQLPALSDSNHVKQDHAGSKSATWATTGRQTNRAQVYESESCVEMHPSMKRFPTFKDQEALGCDY